MLVWLNGEIVEQDLARIDPFDRGFTLGDGVFETMLSIDGFVRSFDKHFARIEQAARTLLIPFQWKPVEISHAVKSLIGACVARGDINDDRLAVRMTLTRGAGPRGLALETKALPTLLITAAPAPKPPERLRLHLSSIRRNEFSPLSRIKALNYGDNLLARHEARENDADEALMLNSSGMVACAAAGNIWTLEGDHVRTPSLDQGVLPGILRHDLFDILPKFNMSVGEGPLSLEAFLGAEEIFVSNSLIGICPVVRVDDRRFSCERMSALRPIIEDAMMFL